MGQYPASEMPNRPPALSPYDRRHPQRLPAIIALGMSDAPVTVVMSTFNEERYVDRVLDSLDAQTVAPHIVVIDGGSTDDTVERLRRRATTNTRLEVHADGVRRSLPAALNYALERIPDGFVAKIDARTFPAADFLERALAVFAQESEDVACVGGRPEQYGECAFGNGVARARMSRFGVGGSGYADRRLHADVDTVQCGVYRRRSLESVGGFDPALQFGEDEELNWRLRQAGYRIVMDTSVRFRYVTRSTWFSAFRQYRNYGRARARVVEKHPEFIRMRHLVPSAALLLGAGLAFASPVSKTARVAAGTLAGVYVGGALLAATAASRENPKEIPHTASAFAALHTGYALGLLEGCIKPATARLVASRASNGRHTSLTGKE